MGASVTTVNNATEIRLLAERQMGEFLKAMPKATGAKGIGPIAVPDGNRNQEPTLADIGITKKQSSTAQKLADIPEPEFRERRAVEIALKEFPKLSDREIARICAVNDKTVAAARADMVGRSEIPNAATRTDSAGRQQPATKPARPVVEQHSAQPSKPEPREIVVPFVVPPQPETRSATQRPVLCGICVALSPSEERWCPEWGSNPHSLAGTGF